MRTIVTMMQMSLRNQFEADSYDELCVRVYGMGGIIKCEVVLNAC